MENNHLFSIVMPTYNSERYVTEAIASVLQQSYPEWELLIVDDCSTDSTLNIVQDFADRDARIRFFTLAENKGPAAARNLAIQQAQGRYIAFLDSDDIWRPEKLKVQLKYFKNSEYALIYSAYEIIKEDNHSNKQLVRVPQKINYAGLLNATVIATVTAAYDTSKLGVFSMPDIYKRQDYALWLKILRNCQEAYGIQEPLALLRKRSGSLSSKKLSAVMYTWKVYRDIEQLSMLRSFYHFSSYLLRAFVKHL